VIGHHTDTLAYLEKEGGGFGIQRVNALTVRLAVDPFRG
jgi:hypothetical protein